MSDPFKPSMGILISLGSIAVHAEEMLSPHGHDFDRVAIKSLLDDEELKKWMAAMAKRALLPVKRD